MSQVAPSKNLWLVVFPILLQSPCFSKMMPAGLHLDQKNPDNQAHPQFQSVPSRCQLSSVWGMAGDSQGETMAHPLAVPMFP